MKGVKAAFVEIRTPKFTKKVQIDPYLEDSALCNMCQVLQGPYFCRELPVNRVTHVFLLLDFLKMFSVN